MILLILETASQQLINLAGSPMTAGQGAAMRHVMGRLREAIEMIEQEEMGLHAI